MNFNLKILAITATLCLIYDHQVLCTNKNDDSRPVSAVAVTAGASKETHWRLFKATHSKSYPNASEEAKRRRIWEENHEFVHRQNSANLGFRLSLLSSHSDLTHAELLEHRTGLRVGRLDHRKYSCLKYTVFLFLLTK